MPRLRFPFTAVLEACRPHNAAAAGAATVVGVTLGSAAPSIMADSAMRIVTAVGITALAVAAANLRNDAYDVAADAVNAPHRPIPSGRLTVSRANNVAYVAAAFACTWSVLLGARLTIAVALVTFAALAYSPRGKSTVLWGNLWVAALSALTLPFGAVVAGALSARVMFGTLSLLLLIFSREILKSLADAAGDARAGLATVATRLGSRRAHAVAGVAMIAFFLSLSAPFAWLDPSAAVTYLLVMSMIAGLPLLHAWRLAAAAPGAADFSPRMKRALRWSKAAGMALLVGIATLS